MIRASCLPVAKSCAASGVSRQAFYAWKQQPPKPDPDMSIRPLIQEIALEFPRYGSRRIAKELSDRGQCVNRKRAQRIMREDNLLCVRKQFKPLTTNSNHAYPIYPNLARTMVIERLNQLWVADITYIRLGDEFVYLAVVIDVYSRKCVGWELSRSLTVDITITALRMAIRKRKHLGLAGLVHHSDQGVQYAATAYIEILDGEHITISMSRKGNPYDNAFAESFMKTLKIEEVYMNEYDTFEQAFDDIKNFIEKVYNEKRLHSGIGYRSPNRFEKEVLNKCEA